MNWLKKSILLIKSKKKKKNEKKTKNVDKKMPNTSKFNQSIIFLFSKKDSNK